MNSTDNNLITFKTITNFVNELATIFGSKNHSLKLYKRLLKKTTLSHETAIKKHIEVFRIFCIENRESIISKNYKDFVNTTAKYSTNVFIDFNDIFNKSDKETSNVIWSHLLTISALVDPSGKAKEILRNNKNNKEANFLSDILEKVETNVKPDSNPLEAVSSIMSSGIFTDLISNMNNGIQDGSLDLGKLMGTVQDMCGSLGINKNESPSNPSCCGGGSAPPPNPMDMLSSLMNTSGGSGAGPDLSAITGMLGPMLSSMNQNSSVKEVEEVEED